MPVQSSSHTEFCSPSIHHVIKNSLKSEPKISTPLPQGPTTNTVLSQLYSLQSIEFILIVFIPLIDWLFGNTLKGSLWL